MYTAVARAIPLRLAWGGAGNSFMGPRPRATRHGRRIRRLPQVDLLQGNAAVHAFRWERELLEDIFPLVTGVHLEQQTTTSTSTINYILSSACRQTGKLIILISGRNRRVI